MRTTSPVAIRFDEVIGVAAITLLVNLVSAFMLRDDDHHHHHRHGARSTRQRPTPTQATQPAAVR